MRVSIVVPAFNEESRIGTVLERLDKVLDDAEVIVVDDGSADRTSQAAKALVEEVGYDLKVITCHANRGKGHAVRTGIEASEGDVVCIQDADLEYDPVDLPAILKPLLDGDADVVYGTRMGGNQIRRMHKFTNYAANRLLSLVTSLLFNTTITDMETGYKAFRGDLVRSFHLTSDDFRIEPELTALVLRTPDLAMVEVPITYMARTKKEGKKIGWADGFKALAAIFYFRFK